MGKLENLRKRLKILICKGERNRLKKTESPLCKGFKIFDNKLAAINIAKYKLYINKPTYVGFCVLELSKWRMLDFHYNLLLPFYGDRLSLLFTDTDSFIYEVLTQDVYSDLFQKKEYFDFASYPKSSLFYDPTNDKVIGKFKDETKGVPIREFVGLKPKMYSYLKDNEEEGRRAKGIQRSVVE